MESRTLLETRYERMIEWLSAFVTCDSHVTFREGQSDLRRLLTRRGAEVGARLDEQPGGTVSFAKSAEVEEFTTGAHLFGRMGHDCEPVALLLGHYDTVFPRGSGFSGFTRLSPDTARGPGVIDMKGGLIVMLFAIDALRELGFFNSQSIEVLIVSDEEIGSPTSRGYIEASARRCRHVLCFEPPIAKDVFAARRKGSARATIRVAGKSAHAGRHPENGANAIVAISDIVIRASKLANPVEGLSVNVGTITGGTARNQVPDLANCEFDLRYSTTEGESRLRRGLEEIVASPCVPGTSAVIADYLGRPPKPRFPAMEDALRLVYSEHFPGRALDFRDTGGSCDGNFTAALGIPTIDTLGAVGTGIHTNAEEIHLPSLVDQALVTTELLRRLAK